MLNIFRLRPEIKLLAYLCLIVGIFFNHSLFFVITITLLLFFLAIKLDFAFFKRSIKFFIIICAFTFLSNLFSHHGRVIFNLSDIYITQEGIVNALLITLRLLIMMIGAQILNATTKADDLLKGVEKLLGPVGRFKAAREVITTTALTLKLLPVIFEEAHVHYKYFIKKRCGFMEKVKLGALLVIQLFENTLKKASTFKDIDKSHLKRPNDTDKGEIILSGSDNENSVKGISKSPPHTKQH